MSKNTIASRMAWLFMLLVMAGPAHAVTPWDAKLTDLAGTTAKLDTKGHDVAVFLFWGSWCSTCKSEMKGTLNELAKKNDTAIFTIAMDQDSKRAEHTVQKEHIPFTVLRDPEKSLIKELGVFGVPHWAIYRKDKSGTFRLVDSQSGFDHEKFSAALKKA